MLEGMGVGLVRTSNNEAGKLLHKRKHREHYCSSNDLFNSIKECDLLHDVGSDGAYPVAEGQQLPKENEQRTCKHIEHYMN